MLADLAIIPIGGEVRSSRTLAKVLTAIKDSGLPYQLTPTSTCIEGSWDEIIAVAKRCHDIALGDSVRVVTLLRFEDDSEQPGKLARNVESVEEQAGEDFATSPEEAVAGGKPVRIEPVLLF